MENNELIDTLNTLIETSRDGDNGFTACAEDAKDACRILAESDASPGDESSGSR